jgi:hypothetical protein
MDLRTSPLLLDIDALKTLTVREVFPNRDIVWVLESCNIEVALDVSADYDSTLIFSRFSKIKTSSLFLF